MTMTKRNPAIFSAVTRLLFAAVFILELGSAVQAKQAPETAQEITLSFAPIVRATSPAVVNIYTSKVVHQRGNRLFDDPFFRRFFGDSFPFSVGPSRDRVENSLGSGVILRADGIVVTNHHVIGGADEIKVVLNDKREFGADILLSDERTDLAVLKLKDPKGELPVIQFGDSEDLEVGDLVLAIGNPFGVGQTVTSGIVSGLARTSVGISDFRSFIQTDAAINPGNSGGALVDIKGRLVGINTAIFSKSGGSQGIGFAVPANMVRRVVSSAIAGEPLIRPWLGFSGRDVDAEISEAIGLKTPGGVIVENVHPTGPAAEAGLQRGDVIVEVEGRPVDDGAGTAVLFRHTRTGRTCLHHRVARGKRGRDAILPHGTARGAAARSYRYRWQFSDFRYPGGKPLTACGGRNGHPDRFDRRHRRRGATRFCGASGRHSPAGYHHRGKRRGNNAGLPTGAYR